MHWPYINLSRSIAAAAAAATAAAAAAAAAAVAAAATAAATAAAAAAAATDAAAAASAGSSIKTTCTAALILLYNPRWHERHVISSPTAATSTTAKVGGCWNVCAKWSLAINVSAVDSLLTAARPPKKRFRGTSRHNGDRCRRARQKVTVLRSCTGRTRRGVHREDGWHLNRRPFCSGNSVIILAVVTSPNQI